jgi:hypothetical protein
MATGQCSIAHHNVLNARRSASAWLAAERGTGGGGTVGWVVSGITISRQAPGRAVGPARRRCFAAKPDAAIILPSASPVSDRRHRPRRRLRADALDLLRLSLLMIWG